MRHALLFIGSVIFAVVALYYGDAYSAFVGGLLVAGSFEEFYKRWVDPLIVRWLDRRLGRK